MMLNAEGIFLFIITMQTIKIMIPFDCFRQIALKALSERLSKSESSTWPNSTDFKPKIENTQNTFPISSPTMLDNVKTPESADPLLITIDSPTPEAIA